MESFLQHLENIGDVNAFVVVAALFSLACVFFFLKLPEEWRLAVSLFGVTLAQGMGQFQDFGFVATLGKFLAFPFFGFVFLSALMMSDRSRGFNPISVVLIGAAIWSILCVFEVMDKGVAIPIRVLWLLLVLAGTAMAAYANTPAKAAKCLNYIFWAMALLTLIALSALATGTGIGGTLRSGRLYPWSANPNQIATVFAFTFIFGFYRSVTSVGWKPVALFAFLAGCGGVGILLTVSRAAILLAFVPSLPIMARITRKPIHLIGLATVFVVIAMAMIPKVETHSFGHFYETASHSNRADYWAAGLNEFLQNPYFGLLGESNANAIDKEVNSHNAYVSILCLGGLALAIPYALTYATGMLAAVASVTRQGIYEPSDQLLLNVLVLLYIAQLLHGFVNEILFYSTFTWAFLGVYFCFFFMNHFLYQNSVEPVEQQSWNVSH